MWIGEDMNLTEWAIKWQIPHQAVEDLRNEMGMAEDQVSHKGMSESAVQSIVRLEASRQGKRLWRNNVGAGKLENGSFLRWGLANDSAKINKTFKSSDLIGIKPVLIQQHHVGTTVGIFLAREIKSAGWQYSGTQQESAQLRFLHFIAGMGGDASFATGEGSFGID